jgi:sphingolipid delta-4 desaturase
MSAWLGVGIVLAQFWCMEYFKSSDWLMYTVSAYFIGAILSHALHALMHDFTHYLCFESPLYNKLMAIFLNFGQGVPSAITFGR